MHAVDLILYVVAAVSFALSLFELPTKVNLIALGLLAWVLVPLIHLAQH